MEIVSFGWNEDYVVSDDFDLNTLRSFRRVREVDGKYVMSESKNTITIKVGQGVAWEQKEIENLETSETKKNLEMYKQWYEAEQKVSRDLQTKLAAIQASLADPSDD